MELTLREVADKLIESMSKVTAAEKANAAYIAAPYLAVMRRGYTSLDPMGAMFVDRHLLGTYSFGSFYIGLLIGSGQLPKVSENLGAFKQHTVDCEDSENPTAEQFEQINKLATGVVLNLRPQGGPTDERS